MGAWDLERRRQKTGENHDTPIILGSHILGSPKPEGTLLERIEMDPELSWESIQERINLVSWVVIGLTTGLLVEPAGEDRGEGGCLVLECLPEVMGGQGGGREGEGKNARRL